MDAHDRGADQDWMAGAAQYCAGVFSRINVMVTTVSTVASNINFGRGQGLPTISEGDRLKRVENVEGSSAAGLLAFTARRSRRGRYCRIQAAKRIACLAP